MGNLTIPGIAVTICLFVCLLFSIIALGGNGWAHIRYDSNNNLDVGVRSVYFCLSGRCGTYVFNDFTSGIQSKYVVAGQACMAFMIPAIIIWFVSFGLSLLKLFAPTPMLLAANLYVNKFTNWKTLTLATIGVATFCCTLAWILWVGVAKPADDNWSPFFSFGLAIVASLLGIAAAVAAVFDDYTADVPSASTA